MFCSTCGTQLTPGLSYCNRCGARQERSEPASTANTAAYLTAITLIALAGLGIMLGGALALRKEAAFNEDIIGIFMLFTFLLVGTVEMFLCRQLSRIASKAEQARQLPPHIPPVELRPGEQRVLPEPLPSVTENTTRTLEYSRSERGRS